MSRLPVSVPFTSGSSLQHRTCQHLGSYQRSSFQFPLHRDPRCNCTGGGRRDSEEVSVPFTSGSSLQQQRKSLPLPMNKFQFPLHRDPRCNRVVLKRRVRPVHIRFSSLYIGILAATRYFGLLGGGCMVSVPFTSGSSLQPGRDRDKKRR